jgi:uncharacterized protein
MGTSTVQISGDHLFLDRLLGNIQNGEITAVIVGLHWTAVVAIVDGKRRCGLASTITSNIHHHGEPEVADAGSLQEHPAHQLAALVHSEQPILAGIGLATINSLLPPLPNHWVTLNAEDVIAERGRGKKVALIGHFPFIPRLYHRVGELSVLEQNPRPGDLPTSAAPSILADAEVVALTSMTIHNHTLPELCRLCAPESLHILLGPSTPLTPVLYDYGFDILCGSVVTDIDAVLRVIAHAGNFRQIHRAGVRTVTMVRPGLNGS